MMGLKHWREAATVILSALKAHAGSSYNYGVLTLKRSAKNDFMPNGFVFPGGALHPSDYSQDWYNHFKKFNSVNVNEILKGINNPPPMFHDINGGHLVKHLALKINAVRETFEETGILLCRNDSDQTNESWSVFKTVENSQFWRSKVNENAFEFLNLCHHFNCYPDVFGLHLWSNWLTPRKEHKKRFDTVFFIASLKEFPNSIADGSEIENLQWFEPDELMKNFQKGEIWLPPPQVYEMARLLPFKDLNALANFSKARSSKGCERWMPERVKTLNGKVTLLPGDGGYSPDDFTTEGVYPEVKLTNKDYRNLFEVLHRIEHMNEYDGNIIIKNYKPTCGHLLPSSEEFMIVH